VTPGDRLRAVPRPWWVIAICGSAVVLAFALVSWTGSTGSVASNDTREPPLPTTAIAVSTTGTSVAPTSAATTVGASTSTAVTTSTVAVSTTLDLSERYGLDVQADDPAVVARPIPDDSANTTPPSTIAPPPWAASTRTTPGGYLGTDVGCVTELTAPALDKFFADRIGPALGWDYQHVYAMGDNRYLWLFQDTFLDHSGVVSNLGNARFVHNAAMLQTGKCFTLLHRGTPAKPEPFEIGDGTGTVGKKWFWPMGGEMGMGQLWVYWVEMVKDPVDPTPPNGLGWHPNRVWVAAYDQWTLTRTAFMPAQDQNVTPMYGYAVASDNVYSYLFGNTFEQNMNREGGFWNGPHSATKMWLARVPRGQLYARPEYRTADGWSPNRNDAVAISSRFFAENPMQPRYMDGQWIAATKVDGYWGEDLVIDVASDPWGPWTPVDYFRLQPRGNDPLKNSYHAHLLPYRDKLGSVLIVVSNNARNMLRDAYPRPARYRPLVTYSAYRPTPAPTTTTTTVPPTTTTTTLPPTTTLPATTTTVPETTTTVPPTTTLPPTTTTVPETTTTVAPTTTLAPTTTTAGG
jgi:hypothetical protein